jgi:hypothetical protein
MPRILVVVFRIILAACLTYSLYIEGLKSTCWHGRKRTYLAQYCLLSYYITTVVIRRFFIIGSLITGVIFRFTID